MLHLYLVRHAAAEDAAPSDALRTLTAKARKRFRKTARALSRRVGAVEAIFTSPLVRAVQTAEILAGEVKHGALTVLQELSPGQRADAVLKALARLKAKSAALVGHDPQLSQVLAALARKRVSRLEFRAGAVVRLDVGDLNARQAEARWWLKSGGRHKGLPLKEAPPKAAAGAKKAAPPASRKTAPKQIPPPALKAAPRKQPPRSAPPKSTAKAAAPKLPAPAPQKFMGSPRPLGPPAPRPVPAPEAPAAPPGEPLPPPT